MWSWGDEMPDRPADWQAIDVILVVVGFIVIAVIGVVAAGGPN